MSGKMTLMLAGLAAGAVNGLLGAGGGMVLVPLLSVAKLKPQEVFPASVAIIAPICVVSLVLGGSVPWGEAVPYLTGSAAGGLCAGLWGRKIPVKWLHRGLGILILWGGWRYLWS